MKESPAHTAVRDGGDLYLNTRVLWPGDVLLTRGGGKESGWIARLSAGTFSHAAVVVNIALIFESDDAGVGYTSLRVDRIERRDGANTLLSALPGVTRAVLLRHPELTRDIALDLEDDLIEALYPAFGTQYPEWAKLASALPGGRLVRRLGSLLLRARDALGGERVWNPGPFCSQLVADALTNVFEPRSIALFVPKRAAAEVSPNTLLESRLIPVADAIRPADPNAELDTELLERYHSLVPAPPREETTGALVKTRVLASRNIEAANAWIAEKAKVRKAHSDLLRPPKS